MKTPPLLSHRRGAVLVLVLLVLIVASTVALEVIFSAQADLLESRARLALLRRRLALRSGFEAARVLLEYDSRHSTIDALDEVWAKPLTLELQGCRVQVPISDEQSKLNVNDLRLTDDRGQATPEAAAALKLLARWDLALPNQENSKEPSRRLNDIVQLVPPLHRSLALIYGAPAANPSDQRPLRDYVTVYGPGTVNVNTAPLEVLKVVLAGRSEQLAERIVQRRQDEAIENLAELRGWSGFRAEQLARLDSVLTVRSTWFSALLVAEDTVGKSMALAVFERTSEGLAVRRWKEL